MKKQITLAVISMFLCVIGLSACQSNTSQSNTSTVAPPTTSDVTGGEPTVQATDGQTTIEQNIEDSETMKQIISGDFAIRNIETGKNIRPYKAGTSDGNDIILYPHNEWKCLTWRFNYVDGAIYRLQNVYTEKTFVPNGNIESGVALWQQPLSDNNPQWEFIEQDKDVYAIKMVGTDLYITISSDETDSAIILMPFDNSSRQLWELIEQYPLH